MRIGRNVIISAILALGAAGSIAASAAVSATVAQAPAVHSAGGAFSDSISSYLYHG